MKSSGHVREEILEVAAKLFAHFGFKKTSIDDVAAAARIGKGSVYLHFASKEELVAEVVRRAADRTLSALVSAVKSAPSPGRKVRAFIETKQSIVATRAEQFRLGEEAMLEILPGASGHRQAHHAREHALLAEILREGNASGAFAVLDPDRLATGLLACIRAVETSAMLDRDDAATRAGIEDVVSVLVRGLERATPPSFESTTAAVRSTTSDEG